MKRTELKRTTPLRRKTSLDDASRISGTDLGSASGDKGDALRGGTTEIGTAHPAPSKRRRPLKPGRGFAASKAQREKVRGMACVSCGQMESSQYFTIDPAHICAKGMGGCDDPLCVIPLCRAVGGYGCHHKFDTGQVDLLPMLEPSYRAELAHCVMHLGLEGTRRRLAPSLYARDEGRAG